MTQGHRPAQKPEGLPRSALALVGSAGGCGLIIYVSTGVPVIATLIALVGLGGLGLLIRLRGSAGQRRTIRRLLLAGIGAGIAGTLAYDCTRWLLVAALQYDISPFGAFPALGQGLLGGTQVQEAWILVTLGAGYHVLNGLGFAVAYSALFGRRGPVAGIAFALGLEIAMIGIYPSWLRIQAMSEFLQMSMVGHVAYGATVGAVARALLRRDQTPLEVSPSERTDG